MRLEPLKRFLAGTVVLLLLAGLAGVSYADTSTKPYIKAFGGDVMTGGWYSDGTNCSTSVGSNYQSYNSNIAGYTPDTRNGGILTYTKSSGTIAGGSSVQYGAIALGEIDGRRAGDGFYSNAGVASGTSIKNLTFSNNVAGLSYGGEFEGSVRQSNCIPDYYSRMPASATTINNISEAIGSNKGDYKATAAPGTVFKLTNGGATRTIGPGERITIYVNGDVYIDNNIVYSGASTASSVPKFALVVKGSIYIDKDVTQLDGMYVAQPADKTSAAIKADDGDIWTCHPANTAVLDYTYPPNCNKTLVVNGALIAKQVNFLRVKGDVASSNTGEDNLGTVSNCESGTCNVSEVVNYTPDVMMGGNFFSGGSSSSTSGLPVDSVISLPSVF